MVKASTESSMPSSKSLSALKELAKVTRALSKQQKEALNLYEPLSDVERFHRSLAKIKLLEGGNRSGKTTAGAIEVAWYARGRHPYRKVPKKAKILAIENTWALIGEPMMVKLTEKGGLKLPGIGPGTGSDSPPILPARLIRDVAWMDKKLQIPQRIMMKSGAVIDFRPAEAGRKRFEGTEYDLVWGDEQIDDEEVLTEIIRGLTDRGGSLIWTYTPLSLSPALLNLTDTASESLQVETFQISLLDNIHIPEEHKKAFIALIPEEFRATRIYGDHFLNEGLVYGEWDPDTHEMPRQELPNNWPCTVTIDPGYANPCAALWTRLLPGVHRKVIGVQEYYMKKQQVKVVAQAIKKLSERLPVS